MYVKVTFLSHGCFESILARYHGCALALVAMIEKVQSAQAGRMVASSGINHSAGLHALRTL